MWWFPLGSLHTRVAFLSLQFFFSSACFFGSNGAKHGLYTALVCSHASCHAFFCPANFLVHRVDYQSAIFKMCMLGILIGAFFFSSRPNKASTAGMSTGNRNIGCCSYAVCCGLLLHSFCLLWIFACSLICCPLKDWNSLIFFLFTSMELWLQMEAYVGLFCSTFSSLIFWCSNAFNIGSCGVSE